MIETPPRQHEPWIDWLRALASIAVVVFHLNEVRPDKSDWYAAIASYGWLGVPVFFVVSGYCVMLSCSPRTGAGEFLFKRYVRVLPPYWASLAVVIGVVLFQRLLTGTNSVTALPRDPGSVLAILTLTTAPVSSVPTLNWVYWTLSYELAFYGTCLALALLRCRLLLPLLITATAASLILQLYPLDKIPGLFFLNHWPLFASGAAIALMLREPHDKAATLLFALACIGIVATEALAPLLAAALTIASLFLVAWRPQLNARLHSRAFGLLGQISHSLYLIHVPIGVYLLNPLVGGSAMTGIPAKIAMDALLLAGCLGFAFLFNRAIELPSQRWSRTLLQRKKRSADGGAVEHA